MAPNTLFGVPEMQDTPPCRLSAVYKPSDFSGGFLFSTVQFNPITLFTQPYNTLSQFSILTNSTICLICFILLKRFFYLSNENNAVLAGKQPVPNQ